VRDLLFRIEHSYNCVFAFEALVDATAKTSRRFGPWPEAWFFAGPGLTAMRPRLLMTWPPTVEAVAAVVPPRHRLVLAAVRLESPGAWDFIAKLNPLEVIRQGLNDRHERRKDHDYRERAESRRLELENQLLENKVLREKISIAKELGATDQDLSPLLNELVLKPLSALERPQDHALIEAAEIISDDEQE